MAGKEGATERDEDGEETGVVEIAARSTKRGGAVGVTVAQGNGRNVDSAKEEIVAVGRMS